MNLVALHLHVGLLIHRTYKLTIQKTKTSRAPDWNLYTVGAINLAHIHRPRAKLARRNGARRARLKIGAFFGAARCRPGLILALARASAPKIMRQVPTAPTRTVELVGAGDCKLRLRLP